MIVPQTFSEKILFSTIRLETKDGVGTGFVFNFKTTDGKTVPVIITNKHVVHYEEKQKAKFFLHTKENNLPTDQKAECYS